MNDKTIITELLKIQKESLETDGEVLSELRLISDNVNDVKSLCDSNKTGLVKILVRVIVFQAVVIAALAGIEVGKLAGWW